MTISDARAAKNFEKFIKAMEHLYEGVYSIGEDEINAFGADEWENLARRCDKLASEFDNIHERLRGTIYDS